MNYNIFYKGRLLCNRDIETISEGQSIIINNIQYRINKMSKNSLWIVKLDDYRNKKINELLNGRT